MVKLEKSIKHWKDEKFPGVFKMELMQLGVSNLPLQKAVSPGKFVHDSEIGITILTTHESKLDIEVKVGITFSEVQWGYCCGEEEPMVSNAYCEILIFINKKTSNVAFEIL